MSNRWQDIIFPKNGNEALNSHRLTLKKKTKEYARMLNYPREMRVPHIIQ